MKIKNRKDIIRDSATGAIIYKETDESRQKKRISGLETEIHNLKDDIKEIKSLLERIVNGR